jgi:hypothetical protein
MRSKGSVPKGFILHETKDFVVIATTKSANVKTGNMVQIWILNRDSSPVASVFNGSDANVCFDCPHRGENGKGRTCYVNVAQGPNAVWRSYRNGNYPYLPIDEYSAVFAGRRIRFGAYGEPVLIPIEIVRAIAEVSEGWTGYTHQWRKPEFAAYRAFIMASCDSAADSVQASAMGWRYFRVRSADAPPATGEIMCPASSEAGHRTTCENCLLCSGGRDSETRKNITIIVHGSGAKNFVSLQSLALA